MVLTASGVSSSHLVKPRADWMRSMLSQANTAAAMAAERWLRAQGPRR